MFIVFENNPQLFSVADGLKVFHNVDQAASYALNRGLSNIMAPTLEALKAQVASPGKALTGGQTGFSVTLANISPVDEAPAAPAAALENADVINGLKAALDALSTEKVNAENALAEARQQKTELALQLNATVDVKLAVEKQLEETKALLAAATEAAKAEAPAPKTSKKTPAAE